MPVAVLLPLDTWQNFYVLVGTAAATLTGLMFVVITLIVQLRVQVSLPGSGIAVFSTPNVFHFGAALLVAAILSAPWPELWPAARSFESRRGDLHPHRALAGTPPSTGIST